MVYRIVDNIWEEIESYIEGDNFALITDENIYELYKENIDRILKGKASIYLMKPGEENKNIDELVKIYDFLISRDVDRSGVILSLGGGMVGDMVGFAASTYKRGVNYVQIPTTLLSQVDSSIGGKTGIDYGGFKNIIGSFYFPLETIIDTKFINTLSIRDITSGLGEIIKYGLIEDYEFFQYIKENVEKIYNKEGDIIFNIVKKSVEIKSSIVEKDKLDLNLRQKLNFGHTIGHSIESLFNYKKYYHGEAIILGMIYETNIAYRKKLIDNKYYYEIRDALNNLVELYKFSEEEINILLGLMKNDKKNKDGKIGFILPIDKGKVDLFYNIDEATIKEALLDI